MPKGEENIGKAFKEAFDNLEIQPDTAMWNNIHQQNIAVGNTSKHSLASKVTVSILVATVISAIIISAIVFSDINNKEITTIEENINTTELITPQNNIQNTDNITDNNTPINNSNNHTQNKASNNNTKIVLIPDCNETDIKTINDDTIESKEIIFADNNIDKTTKVEPVEQQTAEIHNDAPINQTITNPVIETKSTIDTFKVQYGNNPVICFGEDAILEVEQGYYYNWNNGDILNKITVSPTENSTYSVTVTNAKGQTNTHDFYVEIDRSCSALFIPSAFTPNGDGQNDVFKAEGHGIIKMQLLVYNRKGNLVFSTNNINESWDGKHGGDSSTENIFFYHAIYTDAKGIEHTKKGEVMLINK